MSNFNVYLLGIVLIPKSKLSHCLWCQALGMNEWLMSSHPSGRIESLISFSTVWPLSPLLLCAQFGYNLSVVNPLPSYPTPSQPSVHQRFAGSPHVDFCLPIPKPLKWRDSTEPHPEDSRLLFWTLPLEFSSITRALLRLQCSVFGRFSSGKKPGWKWDSPPDNHPPPPTTTLSDQFFIACFSLTEDSGLKCSVQLWIWQVQDQFLYHHKSLIFVVTSFYPFNLLYIACGKLARTQ